MPRLRQKALGELEEQKGLLINRDCHQVSSPNSLLCQFAEVFVFFIFLKISSNISKPRHLATPEKLDNLVT